MKRNLFKAFRRDQRLQEQIVDHLWAAKLNPQQINRLRAKDTLVLIRGIQRDFAIVPYDLKLGLPFYEPPHNVIRIVRDISHACEHIMSYDEMIFLLTSGVYESRIQALLKRPASYWHGKIKTELEGCDTNQQHFELLDWQSVLHHHQGGYRSPAHNEYQLLPVPEECFTRKNQDGNSHKGWLEKNREALKRFYQFLLERAGTWANATLAHHWYWQECMPVKWGGYNLVFPGTLVQEHCDSGKNMVAMFPDELFVSVLFRSKTGQWEICMFPMTEAMPWYQTDIFTGETTLEYEHLRLVAFKDH